MQCRRGPRGGRGERARQRLTRDAAPAAAVRARVEKQSDELGGHAVRQETGCDGKRREPGVDGVDAVAARVERRKVAFCLAHKRVWLRAWGKNEGQLTWKPPLRQKLVEMGGVEPLMAQPAAPLRPLRTLTEMKVWARRALQFPFGAV